MYEGPLVSVLMTAYNREQYIAEAIESVLGSTYKNFELIIVDDCSKDGTVAIAKSYEKKDNRVRVYENENNLGDYVNRNKAADYAKGKYLKYLDSDDVIYPHGLEVMVRSMEKFPMAALGMVYGQPISEPSPKLYTPHDAWYSYFFENIWMQVGPSGSIYKTDIFKAVRGFSGDPYVGDFELNLKLSAQIPVVRLPTNLFFYRLHDQQQLKEGTGNNAYNILNYRIQIEALENENCPFSHSELKAALRTINKLQSRRAITNLLTNKNLHYFKEMIINSKMGWKRFFKGLFTI